MRKILTILGALCAVLFWTGAGETSDPVLSVTEIPAEIATSCSVTASGEAESCQQPNFSRQWVAKTDRGHLFLVTNELCVANACRVWLVEKSAGSVFMLLAFDKTFRLQNGTGKYPVVESFIELSSSQGVYVRFEWNGTTYTRTSSRPVYMVDGWECGTRKECRFAATEALEQQQVDRAVKIWQNSHGISWI
jgi:hypothetical protein